MVDTPSTNAKAEKDSYMLTIRDVYFVDKLTKETTTEKPVYDTGNVYRKTVAKKMEVKGNGKSTPLYASGVLIATVTQETEEDLSFDYLGLATKVLDMLTGTTAENGVSFVHSDAGEAHEFAFGFTAEKSDGVLDAMWFPSTTIDPKTELSYSTSEDEFKEQDVSLAMVASGLRIADEDGGHVIYSKFSNQRDTTATVDDFMKQVVYDKASAAAMVSKP